jgi:uncharacterized membrane protein YhaH (DUF805 family)
MKSAVLDALQKWNVFSGRTSRAGYWWVVLAAVLTQFVAAFVFAFVPFGYWLNFALQVAVFYLLITVGFRRLHDTGRSGWWLSGAIALQAWSYFDKFSLTSYHFYINLHDNPAMLLIGIPAILVVLVLAILCLCYAAALLFLFVLRGNPNANTYGDPVT